MRKNKSVLGCIYWVYLVSCYLGGHGIYLDKTRRHLEMNVVLKRWIWKQIGSKPLKLCQEIVEQNKKNKGNTVQKAEYRLHRSALEELLEVEKWGGCRECPFLHPASRNLGAREAEVVWNKLTGLAYELLCMALRVQNDERAYVTWKENIKFQENKVSNQGNHHQGRIIQKIRLQAFKKLLW